MHRLVDDLTAVFKPLEIKEHMLNIGAILGSGQFGDVVTAELVESGGGGRQSRKIRPVALKRLKRECLPMVGIEMRTFSLCRFDLM